MNHELSLPFQCSYFNPIKNIKKGLFSPGFLASSTHFLNFKQFKSDCLNCCLLIYILCTSLNLKHFSKDWQDYSEHPVLSIDFPHIWFISNINFMRSIFCSSLHNKTHITEPQVEIRRPWQLNNTKYQTLISSTLSGKKYSMKLHFPYIMWQLLKSETWF